MSRSRMVLAFLAIYVIWGSTYYAIRVGGRIDPAAGDDGRALPGGRPAALRLEPARRPGAGRGRVARRLRRRRAVVPRLARHAGLGGAARRLGRGGAARRDRTAVADPARLALGQRARAGDVRAPWARDRLCRGGAAVRARVGEPDAASRWPAPRSWLPRSRGRRVRYTAAALRCRATCASRRRCSCWPEPSGSPPPARSPASGAAFQPGTSR